MQSNRSAILVVVCALLVAMAAGCAKEQPVTPVPRRTLLIDQPMNAVPKASASSVQATDPYKNPYIK